MDSEAFFRLNGVEYPAPTDFTLGEMADMERYFGVDFNAADRSVRVLAATLYIAVRRVDDSVTVEDILSLPMDGFEAVNKTSPLAETNDSARLASAESSSESSTDATDGSVPGPVRSGSPTSAITTASDLETSLI